MDRISVFLENFHHHNLDQTHIPPDSLDNMMKRGLGSDLERLRRVLSSEEDKNRLTKKIIMATDSVFQILDEISRPGTQFVFTGTSSQISRTLLTSRITTLEKYPKVADSLSRSVQLNSDQNLEFRINGRSPLVRNDAVIIDEYAENMEKTHQLLSGTLNRKKMVVFALFGKDHLRQPALEDLRTFEGKRFFYGMRDSDLAGLMSALANVTSIVIDINGHFGVLKNEDYRKYRWDRSKLSPEHAEIVSQAEEIVQEFQTMFAKELVK